MGVVRKKLFGMKLNRALTALSALVILLVFAARAQNLPGHATDFSSVEYFDPPHERQMKTRLSGADALPVAGNNGSVVIQQFKLETFTEDGRPELVAQAPECVYDAVNGVANSPGHLQVRNGDGKFRVEGDGFLWRRDGSSLTISNNVKTVIEGAAAPAVPSKTVPKN